MDDEDDVDIYSDVGQLLEVSTEAYLNADAIHASDDCLSPSLDYILETSLLPQVYGVEKLTNIAFELPDNGYSSSSYNLVEGSSSQKADNAYLATSVTVTEVDNGEQNVYSCITDLSYPTNDANSESQVKDSRIVQLISDDQLRKPPNSNAEQTPTYSWSPLPGESSKPVVVATEETSGVNSNVATVEQEANNLDGDVLNKEFTESILFSVPVEDTTEVSSYVSVTTDIEMNEGVNNCSLELCVDSDSRTSIFSWPTLHPENCAPVVAISDDNGIHADAEPSVCQMDGVEVDSELIKAVRSGTSPEGTKEEKSDVSTAINIRMGEACAIGEMQHCGTNESQLMEFSAPSLHGKDYTPISPVTEAISDVRSNASSNAAVEQSACQFAGDSVTESFPLSTLVEEGAQGCYNIAIPTNVEISEIHDNGALQQCKVSESLNRKPVRMHVQKLSQNRADNRFAKKKTLNSFVTEQLTSSYSSNVKIVETNKFECNALLNHPCFSNLDSGALKRSADQLNASDSQDIVDDTAPPSEKLRLLEQYALDRFSANSGRQIVKSLEYDVLDDLDLSNDGDYDNDEYADNSSDSEFDEIPEDEIDAMLEEGLGAYKLPKGKRKGSGQKQELDEDDLSHEEREKVVLKARGHDHFEVLPEGWLEVTHNSGIPVYLHKQFRVCTLSKPYFLGPGSARKHEIPITAIPCYHYRYERAKESGNLNKMSNGKTTDLPLPACDEEETANAVEESEETRLPSAKIETVVDNNKEKSLDFLRVREYCSRLFEFQTITVRRFKTWAGRRKHQKLLRNLQRPTLPLGTKLITCPLPPSADKDETVPTKPRREFTMNPNGKSHVCILHEYVQHAMRVQPKYIFKELENAKKPYGATVIISEMEYGTGFGSSKKQAKSEAAKATLEILIPQMKEVNPEHKASLNDQQDLAFFDEVRVEDPRVSELCAKAGQPSPYQILLECLKRNYGMGDTDTKLEMNTLKHQKNEFTMTVGKHTAKVICKNKRDGKQRASQAILQALHMHITSWGSLLRLYGKGSCKTLKEKKQEEQQITELQSRASANRPNQSILNKLREEMIKLKTKQESVKPIGKFVPEDVDLPTSSGSNLKNVDL